MEKYIAPARKYFLGENSSPKAAPQKPSPQGPGEKRDFSKYTVLVVDDELDLREAITFDLKRKGFTVITASGGREAWEKLSAAHQINLIITDIKMPDGDGIDLLKKVVTHQPALPVICLTGFAELSSIDMLKLGAKAIFEKPFDRKRFHETIASLMPPDPKK